MDNGRDTRFRFLSLRIPVAREGLLFIFPLLGITAFFGFGGPPSGLHLFPAHAIRDQFFRDPERAVPGQDKAILSPADGKIIRLAPCREEIFLKGPALKVSIFMSVFNVHINRIPFQGELPTSPIDPGNS